MATWLGQHRRIVVEWLPAYAPDLNPVERVWSHTKYADLANFAPDDFAALEGTVLGCLTDTRGQRGRFSRRSSTRPTWSCDICPIT